MSCFVLVHGAWHGAWAWRRLSPRLRASGHDVHTPDLTGLGARAHLLDPDISLATHVADVLQLVEAEELDRVVLVGHSYAGMVITHVAARLPRRIARLVYMDAFVPEDGRSLFDLITEAERARLRTIAANEALPWLLPPFPPEGYGVVEPADAAWLRRRLGPMPIACFEQKARFDSAELQSVPCAYIYATRPDHDRFGGFAARFRNDPAAGYYEVASGHDMMITHAAETAAILEAESRRVVSGTAASG